MTDMKRALVTGGFGFLGSHLVEELLAEPDVQVHVVDNLSSSRLHLDTFLDDLGRPDNLTYDITTVQEFCRTMTDRFDVVFHLASHVGPAGVLAYAGRIATDILEDAKALIDVCIRDGSRLVDVSSSEVYGGGKEGFCSETYPKIIAGPPTARLEYAVGKLAGEVVIQNSSRALGLDGCIVRPFNIAGPRQAPDGGFVLPRFIGQALKGEPLTVFGDGLQIRAFTHVKDIAQGLAVAAERGERGEVYNLGNPLNKTTILDLANQVIAVTGSSSEVEFVDPVDLFGSEYASAADKYPDASKATRELGWAPTRTLEDVISDTVREWKKDHDDA